MVLTMDQHDKDNLDFILSLDKESLKKWFEQASTDDLIYSMEIINQYKEEIAPFIDVLENDNKVDELNNYDMSKDVINSIIHKK
jgi:hypothetical protein